MSNTPPKRERERISSAAEKVKVMELESSELVNGQMLEKQKQEEDEEHFHVLAVDDSLIDRKLLERLLKVSSYKVTLVDSGDKALKYLGLLDDFETAYSTSSDSSSSSSSSSPPSSQVQEGMKVNLIMTDYCMPGMSGYDLLKRVKLQGSSWKDVPVVIMSSENVPSRISMCLEGGAEEFLLKPLQLSDLEKLQQYLMKSLNSPNSSDEQQHSSSIATSDNDSNNTNTNLIISKRKAFSAGPSGRSRLKLKGLAVV